MVEKEEWTPFSWHCPNCGTLVTGHKGSDGAISVECGKCRVVMVRSFKNRQYVRIDVYASKLINHN